MLATRAEAVLSELPQDPPASLDWHQLPGCITEEQTEVDNSISNQDARNSTCLNPVRPPASVQAAVSCNNDFHLVEPEGSVAATPVSEATAADAAPAAARHDVAAGGSDADKDAGLCSHLRVAKLVLVLVSCVHLLLVCLAIAHNSGNLIECEKLQYQIPKLKDENYACQENCNAGWRGCYDLLSKNTSLNTSVYLNTSLNASSAPSEYLMCDKLRDQFQIKAKVSWGSATDDVKKNWTTMSCDLYFEKCEKTRDLCAQNCSAAYTSCYNLQEKDVLTNENLFQYVHYRRSWFFLDFLKLATLLLVHTTAWVNLYYGVYSGPPWATQYETNAYFDAMVFCSFWFMSFSLATWHLTSKSALYGDAERPLIYNTQSSIWYWVLCGVEPVIIIIVMYASGRIAGNAGYRIGALRRRREMSKTLLDVGMRTAKKVQKCADCNSEVKIGSLSPERCMGSGHKSVTNVNHDALFGIVYGVVVGGVIHHFLPLYLSVSNSGAPSLVPAVLVIIDFVAPLFIVMLFAVGCRSRHEEPPGRCCNCLRTSDEMSSQDYTTNACTHCKSRCDWSEAEEWEEPPAEVLRAAAEWEEARSKLCEELTKHEGEYQRAVSSEDLARAGGLKATIDHLRGQIKISGELADAIRSEDFARAPRLQTDCVSSKPLPQIPDHVLLGKLGDGSSSGQQNLAVALLMARKSGGTSLQEMQEIASSFGDRCTQDIGTEDPAFDKFGFVRNKGGGKFEFTSPGSVNLLRVTGVPDGLAARLNGIYRLTSEVYNGKPLFRKQGGHDSWLLFNKDKQWCFTDTKSKDANDTRGYCWSVEEGIDHPAQVISWKRLRDGNGEVNGSMICTSHLGFGFVHGEQKLTPAKPYFEVTLLQDCADGVAIGLSCESFFADSMVGWGSGSIGYHSHDGRLHYQGTSSCKIVITKEPVPVNDTTPKIVIATKVQLTKYYERRPSASDSPLRPGETGVVIRIDDSSLPLKVRAPNGREHGYRKEAIKEVVEARAAPFGPTSKAGDTIGCGILFDSSDQPASIFFTRNKSLVGRVPFPSHDSGMLFPVVSSASPAVVKVNLAPATSGPQLHQHLADEAEWRQAERINRLRNMKELILRSNNKDRLPTWLGEMRELEILRVRNPRLGTLKDVPFERLTKLRILDLQGNSSLTQLPAELTALTKLEKIYLKGCDALHTPPKDVVEKGTAAILEFLKNSEDAAETAQPAFEYPTIDGNEVPKRILTIDKVSYRILTIREAIDSPIVPRITQGKHLKFEANTKLPSGMVLDPDTGSISGTPQEELSMQSCVITARNMHGQSDATVRFAVARDWRKVHPKDWSVDTCVSCFMDEDFGLEVVSLIRFDGKHFIELSSKERVKKEHPDWPGHLRRSVPALLKELLDKNVAGPDYDKIYEAFRANLADRDKELAVSSVGKLKNVIGELKDLKIGKFEDAALGLERFLQVGENWDRKKKCKPEDLEAEVCRLADCPECAKIHAKVLSKIQRAEEARLTTDLATALAELKEAREQFRLLEKFEETDIPENVVIIRKKIMDSKKNVARVRKEIDDIDGWFYGRRRDGLLVTRDWDWPSEDVKSERGSYGQPLCQTCQKYGLDFSTIWADFHYVRYEKSSVKSCWNGVRDKGRENMTIDDFMKCKQALEAKLTLEELIALRFYTSHSFSAINNALRDDKRTFSHPLAAITFLIETGLKKQRKLDATGESGEIFEKNSQGYTVRAIQSVYLCIWMVCKIFDFSEFLLQPRAK